LNRRKQIKIEDNFLPQEKFDEIQKIICLDKWNDDNDCIRFPWVYNKIIDDVYDVDKFQFIHVFYELCEPLESLSILNPVTELLRPVSVFRIKANLLTRTPEIIENKLHVDMTFLPEEKQKQWTTSIFYINTNNGYTKFEDGTKVNSVANRMVSFPSNMKHTGTSCTDEKTRVVINFNYYKQQ
jgi:hypothetical protein